MSTNTPPPGRRPHLQQQKKRAKELLRAFRRGEPLAAGRIERHLPRARGLAIEQLHSIRLSLSEAQLVVAREHGFRSWPRMKRHMETNPAGDAAAATRLILAALGGDDALVQALLERDAALARRSLHTAAAVADTAAAAVLIERDGQPVTARGGPHDWTPLMYALSARLPGDPAERVRITRLLLAHGADPNDGVLAADNPRGYRTALGAAAGRARSPQLVRLLLDAGADPADGPTLWEGSALWEAVRHRDLESTRLQLEAGPPPWLKCHALPLALVHEQPEMVHLLLEHGADPNWNVTSWSFGGTALHEAIVLGRSAGIVGALLDSGAKVEIGDRDGRTPHAVAVRVGHDDARRLLAARGARCESDPVDRWIGACWRGDAAGANSLRPARDALRHSDHQWLARAVRWQRDGALPLLLAGGCAAEVADDDGQTPLHLAAVQGERGPVEQLLAAGAPLEARNFAGQTALQCAISAGRTELIELLLERGAEAAAVSRLQDLPPELEQRLRAAGAVERDLGELFEQAVEAAVSGELERLRELLRDEPTLASLRSSRAHRATLLHYLGANGVEDERQRTPPNAVEIMTCLLEAGADANALCYTYRGGPGQNTFGLLVSSAHPAGAGLTIPLVRTLQQYGAHVPLEWRVLADLSAGSATRVVEAATQATLDAASREAAALGQTELLRVLLARGARVNAAESSGVTALHRAAHGGFVDAVELLLAAGADPRLRDATHDGTPAGWAAAGGHQELARRLTE